jgi:molybdopterin converting factor small subunit
MAKVKFTSALQRFFPQLTDMEIEGNTVKDVLLVVEKKYPGMMNYIVEDDGRLRQHVNIFLGDTLIKDRENLNDVIHSDDEILIFQALSGG